MRSCQTEEHQDARQRKARLDACPAASCLAVTSRLKLYETVFSGRRRLPRPLGLVIGWPGVGDMLAFGCCI